MGVKTKVGDNGVYKVKIYIYFLPCQNSEIWCFCLSRCKPEHRADRDGMRVFSNMESMVLFIKNEKDHSVTKVIKNHEIQSPPGVFLHWVVFFEVKYLKSGSWHAFLAWLERRSHNDAPFISKGVVWGLHGCSLRLLVSSTIKQNPCPSFPKTICLLKPSQSPEEHFYHCE